MVYPPLFLTMWTVIIYGDTPRDQHEQFIKECQGSISQTYFSYNPCHRDVFPLLENDPRTANLPVFQAQYSQEYRHRYIPTYLLFEEEQDFYPFIIWNRKDNLFLSGQGWKSFGEHTSRFSDKATLDAALTCLDNVPVVIYSDLTRCLYRA